MRTTLLFLAILAMSATAYAKPLTLEQTSEAACRITITGPQRSAMGTGTVVWQDKGKYFILTNGHVVGDGTSATAEFYKQGYKSNAIPADIVWRYYVPDTSIDVAILTVPVNVFGRFPPRIIPMIDFDYKMKDNQKIRGAGLPAARWMQSWTARVIQRDENIVHFNMPPEGGQSGSGILVDVPDKNGELHTKLAGIVTWRIGASHRESHGAGIHIARLKQLFGLSAKPDNMVGKWEYFNAVACRCGNDEAAHFLIRNKNTGKHIRWPNGTLKVFCPTQSLRLEHDQELVQFGRGMPPIGDGFRDNPPKIWGDKPENEGIEDLLDSHRIKDLENKLKAAEDKLNNSENELKGTEERIKQLIREKEGVKDSLDSEKDKLRKSEENFADYTHDSEEKRKGLLGIVDDIKGKWSKARDEADRVQDKLLGVRGSLKDRDAEVDRLAKENKNLLPAPHWLDKYTGDRGSLIFNSLIMLFFGGTGGAIIWHRFIYPRVLARFGKFPTYLIKILGKKRLDDLVGRANTELEKNEEADTLKEYLARGQELLKSMGKKTPK